MNRMSKLSSVVLTGVVLFSGCDRAEDPTTVASPILSSRQDPLSCAMSGYAVDIPNGQLPADELETAVAATGGRAFIGLKSPDAARAREAGYRAPLSAAVAEQAFDVVRALGAEVLNVYDAVCIAMVRLPSGAARGLLANPFIDFVEPASEVPVLAIPEVPPSAAFAASGSPEIPSGTAAAEVTPWNVSQVNAPAAWSLATGATAKVMLMGVGIIAHEDNPSVPVGTAAASSGPATPTSPTGRTRWGSCSHVRTDLGLWASATGSPQRMCTCGV